MFSLFLAMIAKLLPLYVTMGAGYGLQRATGDLMRALALLQIYFLAPIVVLTNVMKLDVEPSMLGLPLVFTFISVMIATITRFALRHGDQNVMPAIVQASGTANTGYLGIPVATILFPPEILPLYIFVMVGGIIYESSVGYYYIARSRFSPMDALKKLATLPVLYALILGLVLGHFNVTVPEMWQGFIQNIMGAYVIIGALIIGYGIAMVKTWKFDWAFLSTILAIKHAVWPAVMIAVIMLDTAYLQWFTPDFHKILLLFAILPLAANTAAFAALFNIAPERSATAVALSTILSLILIPVLAILLGLTTW